MAKKKAATNRSPSDSQPISGKTGTKKGESETEVAGAGTPGSALLGHHVRSPNTDPYGDPLPAGCIDRIGSIRFRPIVRVTSVAFSPDGKALASGNMDGTVRLWEVPTGKPLWKAAAHRKPTVRNARVVVAFSPDGTMVASGGTYYGLRFWEAATGKPIREPKPYDLSTIRALAFSPDGKMVVVGMEGGTVSPRIGTVQVIDAVSGDSIRAEKCHKKHDAEGVAVCRDSSIIASVSHDEALILWRIRAGKRRPLIERKELGDLLNCVTFSPAGSILAVGAAYRGIILVDAATGDTVRTIPVGKTVNAVCFSADGKMLAAGLEGPIAESEGPIHLYDASTGEKIGTLATGSPRAIDTVAFSPDQKLLASAGNDKEQTCGHTRIQLWEIANGKEIAADEEQDEAFDSLDYSPDGTTLALARGNSVRLWDVAARRTGRTLELGKRRVIAVRFCPDGNRLISVDDRSPASTVDLWDTATAQVLQSFPAEGGSTSTCISPDATTVASISGRRIRLWDVATAGVAAELVAPSSDSFHPVRAIAFSPDGKTLAVGSYAEGANLYHWPTGAELHRLKREGGDDTVHSLAFSPDGSVLAAGYLDGRVWLWDASSGNVVRKLAEHEGWVHSLTFSSDGKTLASGGEDKTVRLYSWAESEAGRPAAKLDGHGHDVIRVAFAPDGRTLASSSLDETVLLWDLTCLK